MTYAGFLPPLVLVLLYATAAVMYLHWFLRRDNGGAGRSIFLGATVLLHLGWTVHAGVSLGRHPVATVPEFASFTALCLAGIYLASEIIHRNRHGGVFAIPAVTLLQLIAVLSAGSDPSLRPGLEQSRFGLHTGVLCGAWASFVLSFIYAVMLILFHRALRRRQFGRIFEQLPPLAVLRRMMNRTAFVGFILLGIGIGAGLVEMASVRGITLDVRLMSAGLGWLIYGFLLLSHLLPEWTERRTAIFNTIAFVSLILVAVGHAFCDSWLRW